MQTSATGPSVAETGTLRLGLADRLQKPGETDREIEQSEKGLLVLDLGLESLSRGGEGAHMVAKHAAEKRDMERRIGPG